MSQSGAGDLEQRIARLEQQDERLTRALELLARFEPAPATRRRRDWDGFAAVIASFIGLLALVISGYTAYVQRQQLRAQVWPHLQIWKSTVNLGLYVTNQGTGPARVASVRVTVGGAPVKTWADVRKAAGFTDEERTAMSTLGEIVLPPGKEQPIFKPVENEQSQAKFKELLSNETLTLSMTVCYCSILEECWVATFGALQDREVPSDTCPIPEADRFEQ